ncbi:MAG: VCBS domain-containing protein [Pseudomonadota bacterium]
MKSHQANPAEHAALSAVQQAPFPLTPSAQALQASRAAALKRKALEEEEEKVVTSDSVVEDGTETLAADGMPSTGTAAEGAALEAIAPAPLPEMSGMDTLLAQAGPAATGGGAAGGGIPTGLIAGGAVVLLAAAASGGGSSGSPAPAPAPPAPPNKPASISTSEIQRTGYVIEDSEDGEYTTVGNNAITALKVVDADGGADLAFRAATAGELQGKYGTFSFNATSGIWSYTLDNEDPDTQALMGGNNYGHDYLTVYSADGTASAVIEVTVEGSLDQVQTTATMNQGDTMLLNMSVGEAANFDEFYYQSNGYNGQSATYFSAGGFALFTAYGDSDYGDLYFRADGYNNDPYSYDYAYGHIDITVNPDTPDGTTPEFDGTFSAVLTEGTPGAVSFSGSFYDEDNDGGIYTLVLSSDASQDGHFTLNPVAGITVLGNGTSQVAIQGTLTDLNNYFDDGEVLLTIDTDESAWADNGIDAYLVDDDGNMVQTSFNASVTRMPDGLPMVGVFIDDGETPLLNPVFYVPATGTPAAGGSWDLDDFNGYIELYDEEADYSDSSGWVEVTISVESGMLYLDSDAFIDGDLQVQMADGEWRDDEMGDYTSAYQGVQEITLRSYYTYELEDVVQDIQYMAPEAFAAGTVDNLAITLTDADDNDASVNIALTAAAQNLSPYFSFTTDTAFVNFTPVANEMYDGEAYMDGESYATAQLHEDQHISFEGIAVNDPDASGSDLVFVDFKAFQYEYDTSDDWNGIYGYDGTLGRFYVDDAYSSLIFADDDEGRIEFLGSIDDINAMLAAGGLHYAPPPDYDEVSTQDEYSLAFQMHVDDLGNAGYGDASGTLYIGIDMIGTEDPLFILGSPMQSTYEGDESVNLYNMLDGEYVFDAEYNGNGSGGELTITNVTIAGTTGTGTLDQDDIDGDWTYFLGEGDVEGDTVVFNYTISDGTSTWMNTLELEITSMVP